MAITKVSDLNSLYHNILEDSLFVAREMTLMTNLVTVYNGQGYAVRTVGIFAQATAQEVAEAVDYANPITNSKSTKATFTPKEVMVQYLLTDRAVETDDVDDIRRAAATEMGFAMAEKVDKDFLTLFSGFSEGVGAAGSAATLNYVAAALARLIENKARGRPNVVMHPYQWHRIWRALGNPAATFTYQGEIANTALREYGVGNMIGADWYRTANITPDSSDDAYAAVFTREALAFDGRKAYNVKTEYDSSLRATEINGHMGYAAGELRDEFGIYILTDASAPDGTS